ncbi:MAG TPA: hypothetical protein PKE12_06070 [Kiritimatiellia bacterium]|nr:hypothetical protein [Kiritimatiellia bacterium]
MIEYRINLLRGRVPSPEIRRKRYWVMLAYLAVTGALLVLVLGWGTSRLLQARECRVRSEALEAQFRALYPDGDGIREYAALLRRQMAAQQASLQALDRRYATRVSPAPMVQAMAFSLPPGAVLRYFSVDGKDRLATFEILVIGGRAGKLGGPTELMAQWEKNQDISARLQNITFLGSQVEGVMARDDTIWRFQAGIIGKGG